MNTTTNNDDSQLLDLLRSGDHHAFEILYNKYSSMISGNIFKIVKSEEIAAEILQQLFVKIWDSRSTIESDKSFKSYLFRVAQNLVMDYFRKVAIDTRYKEYAIKTYSDFYAHVEENIIEKQSKEEFLRLLERLPEKCKNVYILSKVEGFSHKEISEKLGISLPTVNNHLTKAHKMLKDLIKKGDANGLISFVLCLSLINC
ncbi:MULTISPECIES: RNA polymerase sigma factor [Sphingobacterium]|uniref:RNA polymerase sigma factor n=1 Tax=Sphingobacterium TaxID=28453 RepID=UPI0013DD1AB4|nr:MULTISPECIES: RNA polymerase sigma-70 factor [unclassified Sphingobacterium]